VNYNKILNIIKESTRNKGRNTMRELVQLYAIRAREFSDAVARLGKCPVPKSERSSWLLIDEIKVRHDACIAAANELDRYLATCQSADEPRCSGRAGRTVVPRTPYGSV
jgi:hypothetical protein